MSDCLSAQAAAHAAVHAELGFYAREWAEDVGRAAVECALLGDVAAATRDLEIVMGAWRGALGGGLLLWIGWILD